MMYPLPIDCMESNARRYPGVIAYSDVSRTLTWAETSSHVRALAASFESCGVQCGSRIVTLLDNSVQSALIIHNVWTSGAAAVVLNRPAAWDAGPAGRSCRCRVRPS
jgi:acyl-CoA synthetase (AMP-forming)/AMP-acid ligase II